MKELGKDFFVNKAGQIEVSDCWILICRKSFMRYCSHGNFLLGLIAGVGDVVAQLLRLRCVLRQNT